MRPVVIGGSPGCGKTTLCNHLAQLDDKGVHLQTDYFFHFIAHAIDPSKPESQLQNEAVLKAYCAAAKGYAEAGYLTYIDGVIGPWHHPLIASVLGSFDYILLHAPLPETLLRISQRVSQSSARPSLVERMHPQFEAVLDEYSDNLVLSHDITTEGLAQNVLSKIRTGRCTVNAN